MYGNKFFYCGILSIKILQLLKIGIQCIVLNCQFIAKALKQDSDVCCTGLDMHEDIDRHVVPGICT